MVPELCDPGAPMRRQRLLAFIDRSIDTLESSGNVFFPIKVAVTTAKEGQHINTFGF